MSNQDLLEERDFLFNRLIHPREGKSWVGRSSNEMVRVAITGERIDGFNYPLDQGDLDRCVQTYERAPEHLKERMLPILRGFALVVEEHRSWPNPLHRHQAQELVEDAIRRAEDAA